MGERADRLKSALRDATRVLGVADEVLGIVHRARSGGLVSTGLAVAATARHLIDVVVGRRTPAEDLRAKGYADAKVGIGPFVVRLLMSSGLPSASTDLPDHEGIRVVTWDIAGTKAAVAAVMHGDEPLDGPFVLGGDEAGLVEAMRQSAWAMGNDLMLTEADQRQDGHGRVRESFALAPMPDPGPFFGEPSLDWFVSRMKRHGTETRSMLIVGPSGVGKSTLGRLIARAVDDGRTLKVAAKATRRMATSDVLDLVRLLAPDVLLIDDVSMIEEEGTFRHGDAGMLDLLEALRGKARLVVATLMNDRGLRGRGPASSMDTTATPDPGELYFAGLRPGRVDEVVFMKRPPPRVRERILLHYMGGEEAARAMGVTKAILDDVVKRTHGLTGAYLREVVHRLRVHGPATYKSEVQNILAASPPVDDDYGPVRYHGRRRRRRRGRRKERFVSAAAAKAAKAKKAPKREKRK